MPVTLNHALMTQVCMGTHFKAGSVKYCNNFEHVKT